MYQHDLRPKPKLIVILPPTRNLVVDLSKRLLRSHLSTYSSMYTHKHRPKNTHTHTVYRCIHTEDVSKMLGQTSEASSTTPKQGNEFTSVKLSRYSPKMCRPQPVDILPVSTLKRQMKMKRHFPHVFFMPVNPFATAPGPLKGYDSQ